MFPFHFYLHREFCVRKVDGKFARRDDSEQKVSEGHIGPIGCAEVDRPREVHRCDGKGYQRTAANSKGVNEKALRSVEVSPGIGGETEVWVIEIWTTQNLWLWNGTASIFRYNVDFRISIPQILWWPLIISDGTEWWQMGGYHRRER